MPIQTGLEANGQAMAVGVSLMWECKGKGDGLLFTLH